MSDVISDALNNIAETVGTWLWPALCSSWASSLMRGTKA